MYPDWQIRLRGSFDFGWVPSHVLAGYQVGQLSLTPHLTSIQQASPGFVLMAKAEIYEGT